jgi:hypothetical protein
LIREPPLRAALAVCSGRLENVQIGFTALQGVRKERRGRALFGSVDVTAPSTWQGLHAGMERSASLACVARCGMLGCAPHSVILAGTGWRAMLTPSLFQPRLPTREVMCWRFSHLLELDLCLELLKNVDGFGGVRRMLKRDLRPEAWRSPSVGRRGEQPRHCWSRGPG